jgi:hypothetical protein
MTAKVYNAKMPVTACELLYDRVLASHEALGVPVQVVLTDNGREFCGRRESHPTNSYSPSRASSTAPRGCARPVPMASSSG